MLNKEIIDQRLADYGYVLPESAAAAGSYIPYIISGNELYISGQIPFINGKKNHIGRLGDTYGVEQAQKAAEACALNILAHVNAALNGEWHRLDRCIKLGGFVNATPQFTEHPNVINGASDLLATVLGEQGRHARAAVGVGSLPFGVAVEIDALFKIKD